MLAIILNSDILFQISMIFILLSPLLLLAGLIVYFTSKDGKKKLGIKLMVASIIIFIIGFGTCFAGLSIGH